jgi:hypothetical protein
MPYSVYLHHQGVDWEEPRRYESKGDARSMIQIRLLKGYERDRGGIPWQLSSLKGEFNSEDMIDVNEKRHDVGVASRQSRIVDAHRVIGLPRARKRCWLIRDIAGAD